MFAFKVAAWIGVTDLVKYEYLFVKVLTPISSSTILKHTTVSMLFFMYYINILYSCISRHIKQRVNTSKIKGYNKLVIWP